MPAAFCAGIAYDRPGRPVTSSAGGSQSPLERAVDLLLHVPLGLMVVAREELPRLIAKGRQEASGARFIGQMAVELGQREAGKRARRATEWLADRGLVPDPRRAGSSSSSPATGADPVEASGPEEPPVPPRPPVQEEQASAAAQPAPGALAIPGYDALSAPQVVQRLDGLTADELESVRVYEAATRGRKTILSRVAQLQSGH